MPDRLGAAASQVRQFGSSHRLNIDPGFPRERIEVRQDADCSLSSGVTRDLEQGLVQLLTTFAPLLLGVMDDEQGYTNVDRVTVERVTTPYLGQFPLTTLEVLLQRGVVLVQKDCQHRGLA